MSKEAMQQALEALEKARPLKADYVTSEHYLTLEHYDEAKRKHCAAITALREALAQPAPEAAQGEPVEGGVLVSVDELNNWKALANETAARSVKAERYSVGSELKQRIAEVLHAAQPAQPLISAAPELLEALQMYVTAGFGKSTDFHKQADAFRLAHVAIAKATGEET
jgi:hypothetical protein